MCNYILVLFYRRWPRANVYVARIDNIMSFFLFWVYELIHNLFVFTLMNK